MSSLFLLLTPLLLVFLTWRYFRSPKNLPPGPRPWPIIGNLHQMGKNPHVSTSNFAKKYGPLISLRLGSQVAIVASSPEVATEILKTQDRNFCSRFVPDAFRTTFHRYTLIWSSDCDENWRSLRAICRSELFSANALESQASLRETKLAQMLDFLDSKKGEAVNIEKVIFTTMFNTLSNIIFGQDFLELNDEDGSAGGLKEILLKTLENGIIPNISDFFPKLARFDLQGLRGENLVHVNGVFRSWHGLINKRRAKINSSEVLAEDGKCFVDKMIENGYSNDQICMLSLELFTAGTDTTTSTIEWAMAELIKNKEIMFKVQQELKNEIDYNTNIESQLSKLPYLNAFIKETLRFHPATPFLLPHRALQTCEVMNYTIPVGALILINVWHTGRDPKIWDDPLSFKPERFLNSNLDYKGQDFELIPFSTGKRMCPGLPFGIKSIQSILASLILRFEWILPNDEDPAKLDMNEKFGVNLQKDKPLHLIFKS